jgi:hypothetical protein
LSWQKEGNARNSKNKKAQLARSHFWEAGLIRLIFWFENV